MPILHCTQKWRIRPSKRDVRASSPIRFRAFPLLSEMTARCEPHQSPAKADDCGSPDLDGPAATRVPRNSCAWPQQTRICAERLVLTTLENTAEIVGDNGFAKLGIKGYIQGISCGKSNEIYVYGCSGNGAIVRFTDIIKSSRYEISYPGGKFQSFD